MPRMNFFPSGVTFQRIHKVQFITSCRHFGKYKVKPGKLCTSEVRRVNLDQAGKKTLVLDFIFSSLKSNRMKQKKVNLPHHNYQFTRQVSPTARGSCSHQLALRQRCFASAHFTTGLEPSRHAGFSAITGFRRQTVFCNPCRSHRGRTGLLANYVL